MATKQGTVDFLLDQLRDAGDVTAKKMFGEYGLYLQGRMFALVCDDTLFFKPTEVAATHFPDAPLGSPYPGAKPCLVIPEERWEDSDWLAPFALATALALPVPIKKPKKAKA